MNELGQQTLLATQRAMEGKQSATLVALTTLLDTLAKKGETATLSELCALVKCDQHLIARALGRANTLGVRPGSLPVTTLPEAFHLLGIDRLRSIVLSSLLTQHAHSTNHAQREMAIFSLSSGLVAQTMASHCTEDPEQAFLCGSLRCYGHLVLSTLQPAEFDVARQRSRGADECEAFTSVFGLTPYELAQHLLEDSQLPQSLLGAIVHPTDMDARERRTHRLLHLAIGGIAFTDLVFDPRFSKQDFRVRAHELLRKHAPEAEITTEAELDAFLRTQHTQFSEYAKYPEFRDLAERPMISIGQRINNVALQRSPIVPGRVSHHVQAAPGAAAPGQPETLRGEALARLAADLGARDVLLFGLDPFIGAFRLTNAVGDWSVALRSSRLFAAGEKNLFGLCVDLRQTLAIHDAGEPTFIAHAPVWMRTPDAPVSFFVMPLGGAHITQVLLVGWARARRVLPPASAAIMAYSHTVASAATAPAKPAVAATPPPAPASATAA